MSKARNTPISQLIAPIRPVLVKAAALQACATISGVIPLIAISEIGRLLLKTDPVQPKTLWIWAGVAAISLAIKMLLGHAALGASHRADVDLQLDLKRRIVARISKVPLGWFDRQTSGGLKKLLQEDVSALHYLVAHSVPDLTAAIAAPQAILAFLLFTDWRLAVIVLGPMILGFCVYTLAFVATYKAMRGYGATLRKVNMAAVEYVQGIAPIKTFGLGNQAFATFQAATEDYLKAFAKMLRPAGPFMAISDVLFAPISSVLFVLVVGLLLIERDYLEFVDLLPALFLAPALTGAIIPLTYAQNDMMLAGKAAKRIMRVLDAPVLPEVTATIQLPEQPDVTFDNVCFSYDEHATVLRSVSLSLRPGTMTALVGPSGSGKSTLARLLPRFWDVNSGAIRLAGHDIRDLPLEQLYQTISFVFQDTELLHGTISENIAMAQPAATLPEIESAARAANIHDRIKALPKGYNSVVGMDAHLSGGEAQRIAIARAILANSPILVLDEATAFVDPEAEADIQAALATLAVGKTLLVIAHRLTTITGADQIVVLRNGCVAETGTHPQLLSRNGIYQEMWVTLQGQEITR